LTNDVRSHIVCRMKAFKFNPNPIEERIGDYIMVALELGREIPAILASPDNLHYFLKGTIDALFYKEDFSREIKRLEKKGYVALTKTPEGWFVRMTKKAFKRKQMARIKTLKLRTDDVWDKKWRFYIFDIPEKFRVQRNVLRRKLKELGLYNIQRSVFAYPFDCREELEFLSRYYKIHEYATYIESSYSDIDTELRSYFKVK